MSGINRPENIDVGRPTTEINESFFKTPYFYVILGVALALLLFFIFFKMKGFFNCFGSSASVGNAVVIGAQPPPTAVIYKNDLPNLAAAEQCKAST